MKLHLPHPKFRFTKHVLILLGIAVVVAVVLVGAAEAAHQKKVSDNQAAVAAYNQKQHDAAVTKQINDLQAQLKLEDSKLVQTCNYVKTLASKNKSIIIPQVCVSTI